MKDVAAPARVFIGMAIMLFSMPIAISAYEGEYAPLSDLAMLSIVAAQREGPANLADEDEAPERRGVEIVQTFDMQRVLAIEALQPARNPESVPGTGDALAMEAIESPGGALVLGAATDAGDTREPVVIPGPASLEVVVEDIIGGNIVKPDVVASMPMITPLPVETLGRVARDSIDQPFFRMTGKTFSTTQRFYTSGGTLIDELPIKESPVLGTDEDGRAVLSGACGDAYYVVLLYKSAEDYARDPDSFILNRAFPCSGVFSYPVESLPRTLPSGTYYLLIGEQGEAGGWLPITMLTEIIINRK